MAGARNRPGEPDGPDPSAIVHVAPEATMPTDAPKCAIDGDPGRFGTLEGELLDDPRDAPSESGIALIEERVQREAVALVRALAALVDGGLLAQARPIAEQLARLLNHNVDDAVAPERRAITRR